MTRSVMASDWAALPMDILDSVLERLVSLSDYVRFSVVCMPWFYVAQGQQSRRRAIMPKCPMLMISTDKEDTWNVYNVMDNNILGLEVELPNVRFCGSSKGWLAAIDVNYVITLINPFYQVKGRERGDSIIRLPPLAPPDENTEQYLDAHKTCDYFVRKVIISADPISNAKDCIVAVMYKMSGLAFIRINKDRAWTYTVERFTHPIDEVICVEDKWYFVHPFGQLFSFDITPEDYSDVNLVARKVSEQGKMHRRTYIVHANERDLLLVQRFLRFGEKDLKEEPYQVRWTIKVLVFRLDFVKCKWKRINSLGDISLFMGDNTSESVLASSNSAILPNCIYFTHDYDRLYRFEGYPHCDFGVYSLEYEKFLPIDTTHVANLVRNTRYGRPIWVTPTVKL